MKRPRSLKITDRELGSGRPCVPGDFATCECVCALRKGDILFAADRQSPFSLRIGSRNHYVGVEYGLLGMRVGGTRTVIVPPNLTYHERKTFREIPDNALLVYELKLLALPAKWDADMESRLLDRSTRK